MRRKKRRKKKKTMRNAFEPLLLYEKGSFYQDRLGTKVGKALKRDPCFVSYNRTLSAPVTPLPLPLLSLLSLLPPPRRRRGLRLPLRLMGLMPP
eukprot:COSAG06_NODE_57782_length_279_cov_0.605556_1_plen_93_part_11